RDQHTFPTRRSSDLEGNHATAKGAPHEILINYVSPTFFAALSIPVVRGRNFTPQEADANIPVAIVSEATARNAWPGEDPVGKRRSEEHTSELQSRVD